jgi:hypothetical protein
MAEDLKSLARLFIISEVSDPEYLSIVEFADDYGLRLEEIDALDLLISKARIEVEWDD